MNDEPEILARIKQGDESAFNQLVLENQKAVHMLALRMVGNPDDALDISQRAFIRAYKSIHNFRGDSSIATWLYRITYNLTLKHLAAARVKRFLSLEGGTLPEPAVESTFNQTLQNDFRVNLQQAVAKLPPQQKAVFTFHHLQGLKLAETAEIMNLKIGSVKALHYHAIRKLRLALKDWKDVEFTG